MTKFNKVLILINILIISFFIIHSDLYSLETIKLNDDLTSYSINPYFGYLEDKSAKLTINEILKPETNAKFKKNDKNFNIGYSTSTFWLMFKIKNDSKSNNDYVIEIQFPFLSYIEFYYPDNNKFLVKKSGFFVPFNKRDEKNKNYAFSIKLLNNEEKEFYIKINSDYSMSMPVNIYSLDYFNKKEINANFQSGLYYGSMLVILLINIIIFLFIRNRAYFYFLIFYIFVILVQTTMDNTSLNILLPDSSWFAIHRLPILTCIQVLFSLFFVEYFFNLKKTLYQANVINNILKILLIILIVFFIFYNNQTLLSKIGGFLGIFITLFLLLIGIYYLINKFNPALYYLLAWLLFFFGTFILYLPTAGLIKSSLFSIICFHIGSILLVIFMPIAILNKYNILRKEKALADKTIVEKEKDKFASIGMLLGGIAHEIYNAEFKDNCTTFYERHN